ncbi:MAG: radical SAM protein [Nitrospira sp.]|nr:radical SAM protein [Nitrospira sp.]
MKMLINIIKRNPLLYNFSRFVLSKSSLARKAYALYSKRGLIKVWKLHPEADYFIKKGEEKISPPFLINIGLTNRCNLRCTICGSQHYLDYHKIPRRSMDIDVFRKVAKTLFPLITTVELNSYGEPLLYPHIGEVLSTIKDYGCRIRLQSNATLLTPKIIDMLCSQCGRLNFSIDATGEVFNQLRVGANWEKVDRAMRELMKKANPQKIEVGLYPTVTKRTLSEMLDIMKWAHEIGIYEVHFHRYDPIDNIVNPIEMRPDDDEFTSQRKVLISWIEKNSDTPDLIMDGELIHKSRKKEMNCLSNRYENIWCSWPVPNGKLNSHPDYLCAAPIQYVEIGLDGEIYACCRSQRTKLGYATSVNKFADTWYGPEYQAIRKSLLHGSQLPKPLSECESCIRNFCG